MVFLCMRTPEDHFRLGSLLSMLQEYQNLHICQSSPAPPLVFGLLLHVEPPGSANAGVGELMVGLAQALVQLRLFGLCVRVAEPVGMRYVLGRYQCVPEGSNAVAAS